MHKGVHTNILHLSKQIRLLTELPLQDSGTGHWVLDLCSQILKQLRLPVQQVLPKL